MIFSVILSIQGSTIYVSPNPLGIQGEPRQASLLNIHQTSSALTFAPPPLLPRISCEWAQQHQRRYFTDKSSVIPWLYRRTLDVLFLFPLNTSLRLYYALHSIVSPSTLPFRIGAVSVSAAYFYFIFSKPSHKQEHSAAIALLPVSTGAHNL